MAVSAAVAWIAARFAALSVPERRMTVLACSFHNLGALPFVFVAALARAWPKVASDPEATTRGFSMVFVYGIPWTFVLYSAGLTTIRAHREAQSEHRKDLECYEEAEKGDGGTTDPAPDAPCAHVLLVETVAEALDETEGPDVREETGERASSGPAPT